MRALILLIAIVLLLALVGWVSFSHGPNRSSINLETNEIKKDTREMMESGSQLLKDAERKVEPSPAPINTSQSMPVQGDPKASPQPPVRPVQP